MIKVAMTHVSVFLCFIIGGQKRLRGIPFHHEDHVVTTHFSKTRP